MCQGDGRCSTIRKIEKHLLRTRPCGSIYCGAFVYTVVASQTRDRGEVMQMETYETLSVLFLGGTFLLALLTYIDRNNKRK